MASALFMTRLTAMMPAQCDQRHIPALLYSDPRIPDRSQAFIGHQESPLPSLLERLQFLEKAGVQRIAIPCNTAHIWYDAMQESVSCRIVHIVEAVISDLYAKGLATGKIGIMGTPATLALNLYQRRLQRYGYDCITANQDEVRHLCLASINAVKQNKLDQAYTPAAQCVRLLQKNGADAVVLACTELPLALPPDRRSDFDTILVDSIDALAMAVIQSYTSQHR